MRKALRWLVRLVRGVKSSEPLPVARRLLFLDDDPRRAEIFLAEHPQAVWVETVPACVERLHETWDEVHLDHDLGGRQGVKSDDVDCGMEVIRWLCKEPRDHLRQTSFFVHTHNLVAGLLMVLQMRSSGFSAEFEPFGQNLARLLAHNEPTDDQAEGGGGGPVQSLTRWLTRASFWRWPARKTKCAALSQVPDIGPAVAEPQRENCQ